MHSKPDTPILPLLQHSIFLLNSLLSHDANLSNIHLATDLIVSGVPITSFWYSCSTEILAPRRQAIIHKIRNPKRETNPKNSMPIVKSETSLFGTLCSFDHLELFRLSDFELRVFSAFLPINREGRWLPRRINAAETLHSAFEAIAPLL